MTARDEAQRWLEGKAGPGWVVSLLFDESGLAADPLGWRADMHHVSSGATFEGIYAGDEMLAARACWTAWQEATKAEHDHANRLAEALRDARGQVLAITGHCAGEAGITCCCASGKPQGSMCLSAIVLNQCDTALAAHAARREGPTRKWLEAHADDGNVSARNPDLFSRREGKEPTT